MSRPLRMYRGTGSKASGPLCNSSLHCEPCVEVSHVIDAGHGRRDFLFDLVRAEVAVLIEKLREVWSNPVAGCQAAKESCSRNSAAGFWPGEIGAIQRQIRRRCVCDRIAAYCV